MPTPWITISVEQLDTAKAAALIDALRTAALRDNQADPVLEVITSVTNRIRMEIAAGGRTVLDADATKIPPSLKGLALRLIVAEGQQRLNIGNALPLSDDDREAMRHDIRFLERIAKGEITVEAPTNPESTPAVQSSSFSPMISARSRSMQRENQDGA